MGVTLILSLLRKFWPYILLALVVGGALTYVKVLHVELNHYKSKVMEIQSKYDQVVVSGKIKEADLLRSNQEITARYKSTLKDANDLVIASAKLNAENIKNAKELRDTKLSLDAVRLFNASKSTSNEKPSVTVSGNAPTGTTTQEIVDKNLQDLLLVVNENDANHLKCIAKVENWQKFWKDYQVEVGRINATQH